jgi:hypothetical protein
MVSKISRIILEIERKTATDMRILRSRQVQSLSPGAMIRLLLTAADKEVQHTAAED